MAGAPAILAGTLALTLGAALSAFPPLFNPEYGVYFVGAIVFNHYLTVLALALVGELLALSQLGFSPYAPNVVVTLVVWSFVSGGILDRYARNRPTRGRGFFGACGAHFPGLLRLGVMEWLIVVGLLTFQERYPADGVGYATMGVTLAAGLLFLCARVRLVVEDRRSAIGAVLAGARFIRRNPAAVPTYLIFAAAVWGSARLWFPALQSEYSSSREGLLNEPTLLSFAASELIIALMLFLALASWASAIALFQARLAHASYTAGPPVEWPESPAAEAIRNLAPASRP